MLPGSSHDLMGCLPLFDAPFDDFIFSTLLFVSDVGELEAPSSSAFLLDTDVLDFLRASRALHCSSDSRPADTIGDAYLAIMAVMLNIITFDCMADQVYISSGDGLLPQPTFMLG